MNFDFDKMSNLAATNPQAFEAERKRLILEYLNSVPENRREKCEALQDKLDVARITMTPNKFMEYLSNQMFENLANIHGELENIRDILEDKDNAIPHNTVINKIAYTGHGFKN